MVTPISRAQALQQAGKLDEACQAYLNIIRENPGSAAAVHYLGLTLFMMGKTQEGFEKLRESIRMTASTPHFHDNYGKALNKAGRKTEAVKAYIDGLDECGPTPEIYNNLGRALCEMGVGRHLGQLGHGAEAALAFRCALRLKPDMTDARENLAATLRQLGRHKQAQAELAGSAPMQTNAVEVEVELARRYANSRKYPDFEDACRRALAIQPDDVEVKLMLAEALCGNYHYDQALLVLEGLLREHPEDVRAAYALGSTHASMGNFEQAENVLRPIVTHFPGHGLAWLSMGNAMMGQLRIQEGLEAYDRAIAIIPDNVQAHTNRGMALLMMGRYHEGWPEYEWRRRMLFVRHGTRQFDKQRWDGEALNGRTILVVCEQGIGDMIQFARFATSAAQRGGRVVMACPQSLMRLARTIKGVVQVVPLDGPFGQFDLYCDLLSLPTVMDVTLENLPADVPYVHPADEDVRRWKQKLSGLTGLRVGLVWAGDRNFSYDATRSISLPKLAPLLSLREVSVVSLQKQISDDDRRNLDGRAMVLSEELTDFAETAAVIANLDVVVTVDTAAAHLAGALGSDVMMLSRFEGDWRWLPGRTDNPWYPTMRIFRQSRPQDWNGPISEVKAVIEGLVHRRGN